MAEDNPGQINVPLVWTGPEELPVLFTNQFIGQADHGEVFLTFGQLTPPAILGATEEERREQAEAIQFVPVKPVVRLALTPSRLLEVAAVIETTLKNVQLQEEQFGDPRNG